MSLLDETSPLESCHAAEAKIQDIEKLLLEPSPEILERCERELREVIGLLEGLISAGKRNWSPEAVDGLYRIQRKACSLRKQIDHASNLWAGWLQLRLGTGYTERGRPVFSGQEPGSTFEA